MDLICRQSKLKMIGKILKSLIELLFKFKIRLMTSNNSRMILNTSKMWTLTMIRMDSNIRIGNMINTTIIIPIIIMTDSYNHAKIHVKSKSKLISISLI